MSSSSNAFDFDGITPKLASSATSSPSTGKPAAGDGVKRAFATIGVQVNIPGAGGESARNQVHHQVHPPTHPYSANTPYPSPPLVRAKASISDTSSSRFTYSDLGKWSSHGASILTVSFQAMNLYIPHQRISAKVFPHETPTAAMSRALAAILPSVAVFPRWTKMTTTNRWT